MVTDPVQIDIESNLTSLILQVAQVVHHLGVGGVTTGLLQLHPLGDNDIIIF